MLMAARALAQGDGWLKMADNSIDYSLGNTTKQALWLPTSREAKYKAKQAVDSFFVRMGDVVQAGTRVGRRAAGAGRAGVRGGEPRPGRTVVRRRRAPQSQLRAKAAEAGESP